jgi:hypothetical protein
MKKQPISKFSGVRQMWLPMLLTSVLLGAGCNSLRSAGSEPSQRTSLKLTFSGSPAPGRPVGSQWVLGTPITAYYHGPGGGHDRWGPLTPGMAKKLADGGFNLVWGTCVEDLDVAHAHGLRVLMLASQQVKPWLTLSAAGALNDPLRKPMLDALIEQVKDHPAMYAWQVIDEPSVADFSDVAAMVAYLREHDPKHLAMVNLFPTYASAAALGTAGDTVTAYREHLRLLVEIVKPDLLSWDHYQLRKTHDGGQYFLNLALVREAAVKHGLPFLNVVQAVALSPHFRVPTGNEGRYLAFTTLAYGGQGISQFVYWPYSEFKGGISEFTDDNFNAERAKADAAAPLTPLGEALCEIHPEFIAIGTELQPLTSLGAYHLGAVPSGAVGLPTDATFTVVPPVATAQKKGILLGYFGTSGQPTHVLAVNLDYNREINTTVVGPAPLQVFDAATGIWHAASDGARAQISMAPGGGKLLRLR